MYQVWLWYVKEMLRTGLLPVWRLCRQVWLAVKAKRFWIRKSCLPRLFGLVWRSYRAWYNNKNSYKNNRLSRNFVAWHPNIVASNHNGVLLSDCMTDSMTMWLTVWQTVWPYDREYDPMTISMIDSMTEWPTVWPSVWPTVWTYDRQYDRMSDIMIDRMTDSMTDSKIGFLRIS